MKYLVYLFFIALPFSSLLAQDVIVTSDHQRISCKVEEIGPEMVKYKKAHIPNGPAYSIYKSTIDTIYFHGGAFEVFNSNTTPHSPQKNIAISQSSAETKLSTFQDPRDSTFYKIVQIGNQIWFAENLAFDTTGSSSYSNNAILRQTYGLLYTYESALTACPCGWHLPSDEEWKTLEVTLGMDNVVDESGWRGTSPGQAIALKKAGSTGFNVGFGGYKMKYNNSYVSVDKAGYYWTSTPSSKYYSWIRSFNRRASIKRTTFENHSGLNVRCLKNSDKE